MHEGRELDLELSPYYRPCHPMWWVKLNTWWLDRKITRRIRRARHDATLPHAKDCLDCGQAAHACCEHSFDLHDQHGCTVDVSEVRRTYERCHGLTASGSTSACYASRDNERTIEP